MNRRVLGVIPARLSSTRLPRKPLVPLLGRPLIQWVWERARSIPFLDHLVVATDSNEVADVCQEFGATVRLTDPDLPSGTDRVAAVAEESEFEAFPLIVNVQGDEPLVDAAHVQAATDLVASGAWSIGTCACPIGSADEFDDPAAVKVVRAETGRALYFSRAPVPHPRDGRPASWMGPFLRHIGVYAYTRAALREWVARAPSPLEGVERLEQLRPLEAGEAIGVAVVSRAEPGVDTPEDVTYMEERLKTLRSGPLAPSGA